jgi:hypothetical protein
MRLLFGVLIAALLAACSMSAAAPTATHSPAPTATRTPTPAPPTRTPFVLPSPPPVPTSECEDTPPTRLINGERGRVLDDDPRPVRIRSLPGLSSDIVASIPANGVFFVMDGPRCEQGYAWFYVRYQRIEGWIAEGNAASYFVEPYPPAG